MTDNKQLSDPKVGALAVTYRGDELLLVQRKKQPQRLGWGFPGGSVNPNERIIDAAVRELKEETGVDASPIKTLHIVEVREFDEEGRHHHFILVPVLCQYTAGVAVADDDALECQWLRFTDITAQSENLIDQVATVAQEAKDELGRIAENLVS